MIGLDTNVLARYLIEGNDSTQADRAERFILSHCTRESPCLISCIVLCELVWVLRSRYGFQNVASLGVIEKFLATVQFRVTSPDIVRAALQDSQATGADFSDSLIGRLNQQAGCTCTVTFDQKAMRLKTFQELPSTS